MGEDVRLPSSIFKSTYRFTCYTRGLHTSEFSLLCTWLGLGVGLGLGVSLWRSLGLRVSLGGHCEKREIKLKTRDQTENERSN